MSCCPLPVCHARRNVLLRYMDITSKVMPLLRRVSVCRPRLIFTSACHVSCRPSIDDPSHVLSRASHPYTLSLHTRCIVRLTLFQSFLEFISVFPNNKVQVLLLFPLAVPSFLHHRHASHGHHHALPSCIHGHTLVPKCSLAAAGITPPRGLSRSRYLRASRPLRCKMHFQTRMCGHWVVLWPNVTSVKPCFRSIITFTADMHITTARAAGPKAQHSKSCRNAQSIRARVDVNEGTCDCLTFGPKQQQRQQRGCFECSRQPCRRRRWLMPALRGGGLVEGGEGGGGGMCTCVP